MIYDFDYFNRFEQPKLVLCQPDDREIGTIGEVSDLKMVINLNEVSTLSYKIYNNDSLLNKEGGAVIDDEGTSSGEVKEWIPDTAKPNIYRLHKERRQVHALGVGYFIITDVTETEDETGVYKTVNCKSCEYELNNIVCPGVALKDVNMYQLYNTKSYEQLSNYERFKYLEDITTEEVSDDDTGVYVSESCILFNILCYAPTWRLSDACIDRFENDADYKTLAAEMRNLEDEDTTIYSFLKTTLSEAWDCFVMFNIEDRTIDIYTYDDVLVPSDIVLSEANVLENCTIKSDINDYVNSLKVSGGTDDLFISDFTPTGENVVYNFDHDIAIGMIDGELKEGIEHWKQVSDLSIKLDVPDEAKVPVEVYPDTLTGYEGNDLYRFLYAMKKNLKNWSDNYEESKAKGVAVKDRLAPPEIGVNIESNDDFGDSVPGEYKLTIKTPLAPRTEAGVGDRLTITAGDLAMDFTTTATTASAQATALASAIRNDSIGNYFSVTASNNTVLFTQRSAGEYVPGYYLTNHQLNIQGVISLTIETFGHTATAVCYATFDKEFDYENAYYLNSNGETYNPNETYYYISAIIENVCTYTVADLSDVYTEGQEINSTSFYRLVPDVSVSGERLMPTEWTQSFYPEGDEVIETSTARKILQYLEEELILIEDCYMYAEKYKEAYDVQVKKLNQEAVSSGYSSGIFPNQPEYEAWINEYNDALIYQGVANNMYTAFLSLKSEIATWVAKTEEVIDQRNYAHTFQGAFKDYYRNKYPSLGGDEIETKSVSLYNRLTRILKQQKYQDNSLVITDAMTMVQKYGQEEQLYNKAVTTLAKLIQPNAEISMEAEPFIFSSDYSSISKNIKMGYCIFVELPNGEVPLYHLNQITIDYESPACQLTFGDRIRSSDPADIFGELQKTATTAANIIASERIDWGVKSTAINYLMKEKDADIATTFRAMSNSVNNVSIDSSGLSCYAVDPTTNEEKYGFWGANGALMFYDYENGERKPELAIGRIIRSDGTSEYGFWGNKIIANTITAEKLAVGSVTNGSNYLRNGSFEGLNGRSASDSSTLVNYWVTDPVNSSSTEISANNYIIGISANTSSYVPYTQNGDKCLYLRQQNKTGQVTERLAGGTYTLSYYFKFGGASDSLKVLYRTGNSPFQTVNHYAGTISENVYNYGTSGAWEQGVIGLEVTDGQTVTVVFQGGDGSTYAYVDSVMLAKGKSKEYTPHVSEVYAMYTKIDDTGINIFGGNLQIYDQGGTKRIYTDDSNLYVTGNITATTLTATQAGTIAGWKIDSTSLYKEENSKKVMGFSTSSDRPAIWAGYTYNTSFPSVTRTTAVSDPEGFDSGTGTNHSQKAKFMLLQDGTLFATGADITGNINATSLTLGGSTIGGDGSNLTYGSSTIATQAYVSTYVADHTPTLDIGGWQAFNTPNEELERGLTSGSETYKIFLTSTPKHSTSWVLWAGTSSNKPTTSSNLPSGNTTYFGVTADGKLYCRGAYIDGTAVVNGTLTSPTITAGNITCDYLSAGNISLVSGVTTVGGGTKLGGSWTIGANTLYTTIGASDSSDYTFNNKNTFFLKANGDAISKGHFYTYTDSSNIGIEISTSNIYFKSTSSNSYAGAISQGIRSSLSNNASGSNAIFISGWSGIVFGGKTGGLKDNFQGLAYFDTATTNSFSFIPVLSHTSGGSTFTHTNTIGDSSHYWDSIYVKNIYADSISLSTIQLNNGKIRSTYYTDTGNRTIIFSDKNGSSFYERIEMQFSSSYVWLMPFTTSITSCLGKKSVPWNRLYLGSANTGYFISIDGSGNLKVYQET